jgi:hypothetical protein
MALSVRGFNLGDNVIERHGRGIEYACAWRAMREDRIWNE